MIDSSSLCLLLFQLQNELYYEYKGLIPVYKKCISGCIYPLINEADN
jgi:hypothetical protein